MRDYAKLSPFFWVRGSGRRLRGDAVAQVVAAYLSTSPASNMIGVYYVSIVTIADETGHSPDEVRAALGRIEKAGYAYYDPEAGLVWIPNHAWFEIGPEMTAGDKRRKRVSAEIAQVDGHRFADEFRALYGEAYGLAPDSRRTPSPPPTKEHPEFEKGHPESETNAEGASADLEQIRSDQDRSDQDRSITGQDRIDSTSADAPTVPIVTGVPKLSRGTRLPAGWTPSGETQVWARSNGAADPCGKVLDEFRDYWAGVPGARGVKLDWDATYRNHVRRVAGWVVGPRGRPAAIVQPGDNRAWKVPEDMP